MNMHEPTNRPLVIGKVARAEVCGCGQSIVLTLGAISLRLDLFAVEDIAMTLKHVLALAGQVPHDPEARPPLLD